jgi:hypothetical protein
VAAGINFRYVPHRVFAEPDVPIRSLGSSWNQPQGALGGDGEFGENQRLPSAPEVM